jgi:glycosyltransferase involved in cell wall biosynthesis
MLVSIIVPCRNEALCIDAFLVSVFEQSLAPGDALEVVVADGMSDDATRDRLTDWARRRPDLVVVDNPHRTTPAALNRALQRASGEIIVRMDVHTRYADDYVATCVRTLQHTGATCVGGAWRPVGDGGAGIIAAAFRSRFGSGGAASRRTGFEGPVDTVYLGAWRREALVRLGGFDETLVRNQDDELNLRIHRAGGIVWQSPAIRSWYTPRASFGALFGQFHQYGYWKVAVIRKHRLPASPRHLVPFLFVFAQVTLAIGGVWWRPAWGLLAALSALYVAAAVADATLDAHPPPSLRGHAGFVWACMCMHVGYGLGFVRGLVDFVLRRRLAPASMVRLTR